MTTTIHRIGNQAVTRTVYYILENSVKGEDDWKPWSDRFNTPEGVLAERDNKNRYFSTLLGGTQIEWRARKITVTNEPLLG